MLSGLRLPFISSSTIVLLHNDGQNGVKKHGICTQKRHNRRDIYELRITTAIECFIASRAVRRRKKTIKDASRPSKRKIQKCPDPLQRTLGIYIQVRHECKSKEGRYQPAAADAKSSENSETAYTHVHLTMKADRRRACAMSVSGGMFFGRTRMSSRAWWVHQQRPFIFVIY